MSYIKISVEPTKRNNFCKTALMYKGKPLADPPKTYKKIEPIWHSLGSDYNSDLLVLYLARDKTFRYEIYRDGCFYPYYGRIEFI